MRRSFSDKTKDLLEALGARNPVRDVVDVGCATGLSSRELVESFPGCSVIGVDLSEYFLAVGRWQQHEAGVREGGADYV
eukprot:scaffold649783_cov37-Prasinocladus_malaysianus.AAC.1